MHLVAVLALAIGAPAQQTKVVVQGSIDASLAHVLGHDGSALAAQVARLVRWRGDVVKNVHKGDELWVLYEEADGPELVAMTYKGSELTLNAFRQPDAQGVPRYYDDAGKLIEPGL